MPGAVSVSSILLKSLVGMNIQDNLSACLKEVDINTMKPADVWAQVTLLLTSFHYCFSLLVFSHGQVDYADTSMSHIWHSNAASSS